MGRFISNLNRIIWALALVLGVIAGAMWIHLYMQTGMTPKLHYTARLFGLVFILLIMAPVIAFVHEMGHAIAAWMMGYRVHFIAVMSFGFAPQTRRFHRVQDDRFYELGGFVQFSAHWLDDNKWKDIFVYSAGVLACLILALVIYSFDLFGGFGQRFSLYAALAVTAASVPNLFPFSWRNKVATDGKLILERLRGSGGSKDSWATNRGWAAYFGYINQIMTDEEWASVRELDFAEQSDYMGYIARKSAWERTDVKAYVHIYDATVGQVFEEDPDVFYQDIVMLLLAGRELDPSVKADFEAQSVTADSSIIEHFANVLFTHRYKSLEAARTAVKAARDKYTDVTGLVAPEEDAIFSAVEKGEPLPEID